MQDGWQDDPEPEPARPTHYPTFRTATRAIVTSRRLAQQRSLLPRLSDAEQGREDRRTRMVERFRVLEQRAQEDEERAEQSIGKRAHSASAAESPRRQTGGGSYLVRRPDSSIARPKRRTLRPGAAPMAHMRRLDLKPLGASQASIAELKVTVSHLDHLKSDVAGWIAAASEDHDVIEPKPGTRMVLGPLDSPNTRATLPLNLGRTLTPILALALALALALTRSWIWLGASPHPHPHPHPHPKPKPNPCRVRLVLGAPSCAEAACRTAGADEGRELHYGRTCRRRRPRRRRRRRRRRLLRRLRAWTRTERRRWRG